MTMTQEPQDEAMLSPEEIAAQAAGDDLADFEDSLEDDLEDDGDHEDAGDDPRPRADLGGFDLAGSPGAGLLGLVPTEEAPADTAPAQPEPEPTVIVVLHEDEPSPRRRAEPENPRDPETHEAARRLGQRSAEVRRHRRLAPKIPTPTIPRMSPSRPVSLRLGSTRLDSPGNAGDVDDAKESSSLLAASAPGGPPTRGVLLSERAACRWKPGALSERAVTMEPHITSAWRAAQAHPPMSREEVSSLGHAAKAGEYEAGDDLPAVSETAGSVTQDDIENYRKAHSHLSDEEFEELASVPV